MFWLSIVKIDGGSVGYFVWLYGFQVLERKYLMFFIIRLVLLEIGRWWKEECFVLKRSFYDILEDWGLIIFFCKVKNEES